MSTVQRIDDGLNRTHGWQARAYVRPGVRLTKFFSDKLNGGKRHAYWRALSMAGVLHRKASILRKIAKL